MTQHSRVADVAPPARRMLRPGVARPTEVAPVFVDPSGRRERWVRATTWAVGAVVVAYLALLAVSLVGPPGVLKLAVPGVGPIFPGAEAPNIGRGTTHARPREVFHSHPPSAAPPSSAAPSSAPTTALPVAPTVAPAVGAAPGASATASPTARAAATGSPTVAPTTRATATTRPSATGKPTAGPTPTKSRGVGKR